MNKEKLNEAKKVVMYEIGHSLEVVQKTGLDFSTKMTVAGILGALTATLDCKLDDIIQSEPEEKTNFDVITESPEKLAKFILDQYGYSQVKEGVVYLNLGWWLNEKAGE
jgi:DNA-binding Xre family transcriptional regulator